MKALYNLMTGKVGCVLLQATCGGDTSVSHLFDVSEWEVSPEDGQALLEATETQWRALASMPVRDRVERWKRTRTQECHDGQSTGQQS